MDIMKIDDCVYRVCREWYDGETAPLMTAVAYRHSSATRPDVNLAKLLSEIAACGRENGIVSEAEKIAAAEEWLKGQLAVVKAKSGIAKAVARARAAGLDRRDVEDELSRAWAATQ